MTFGHSTYLNCHYYIFLNAVYFFIETIGHTLNQQWVLTYLTMEASRRGVSNRLGTEQASGGNDLVEA